MPRLEMTYQIAHAAGRDAGNRNMRVNGRTKWNDEDYMMAAAEFNRLLPEPNFLSNRSLSELIKAGSRVKIRVPGGTGRNGVEYCERTGRAVMRGPHGWVLNMGGRHGTPAVASERNIVRVKV